MLNLKLKNTKNEFRDTKLELNVFTPMSPFKENKLKEEFKNSSEKIKRSANELNNNNSAKKTNSSLKKNNKENVNLTFSSIIQNH